MFRDALEYLASGWDPAHNPDHHLPKWDIQGFVRYGADEVAKHYPDVLPHLALCVSGLCHREIDSAEKKA